MTFPPTFYLKHLSKISFLAKEMKLYNINHILYGKVRKLESLQSISLLAYIVMDFFKSNFIQLIYIL